MACQLFDREIQESEFKIKKLCRDGLQFSSYDLDLEKTTRGDVFQLYSADELSEKAKEAEEKFDELVSNAMEQNRLPQYLSKLMEEWQTEAEAVFKQYDDIITLLNHGVDSQDMDYRKKIENHCNQHEEIRDITENLILEINRIGREEICATRETIINHSKQISDELWSKNGFLLDETSADKPFDTYLWKIPTEMLTLKQLEDAFLVDQNDILNLRMELLSEVCKMRNKLEINKMNYNLERQILEQEIFNLKQNCSSSVPAIAKMKRKCFRMLDRKEKLLNELQELKYSIKKERELQEQVPYNSKDHLRDAKFLQLDKMKKIFGVKKQEVCMLTSDILTLEKFLYENILQIPTDDNDLNKEKISLLKKAYFHKSDQFWTHILEKMTNCFILEKTHYALSKYWEELQCCKELLVKNQELSTDYEELKVLIRNYHSINKS